MASEGVHIELANRNQDFLDELMAAPSPFSDWIATAAFYKCVHVTEAVFANNEPAATKHSIDHQKRNHLLRTSYPKIWTYYSLLYRASRIARYLEFHGASHATFSGYMNHGRVLTVLLDTHLVGVENESLALLSGSHVLRTYGTPPPIPPATPPSPAFALPPAATPGKPSTP